MKYVLMFCETEAYQQAWAAKSEADRGLSYEKVNGWFAEHADKITRSMYLQPARTATTVRMEGRELVVTDGPFVEGKEVISGYVEVEVPDLDEALRMAKSWPACPLVEIRPAAS
jgi:hypothetical protein